MKKLLLKIALGISLFLPFVASAQVSSNFWKLNSSYLSPVSSVYGLNVPGLATSTTGCLSVNSTGWISASGSVCGGGGGGSAYPFPLTGNATSTLTQFNGGLTSYASSTIGAGGQTTGLTIFGGATTTGNAYFAGNLGIGAVNPQDLLDIQGTINGSTAQVVRFANVSTSANSPVQIVFSSDEGDGFRGRSTITGGLDGANNGYLSLSTRLAGTLAEKARLTSAGNFGLSTTSPFARLSIHANNGDTNTTLLAIGSSTASVTTTLFSVSNTGTGYFASNLGIGIKNPVSAVEVLGSSTPSGLIPASVTGASVFDNYQTLGSGSGTTYGVVGLTRVNGDAAGDKAYGGYFSVQSSSQASTQVGLHVQTASGGSATLGEFIAGSNTILNVGASGAVSIGTNTGTNGSLTINGSQDATANPSLLTLSKGSFGSFNLGVLYNASGDAGLTLGNAVYVNTTGQGFPVGIGTTSPAAKLAISLNNGQNFTGNNAFLISSSTSNSTTTLLRVLNTGAVVQNTPTGFSSDFWDYQTNGTNRLQIQSDGSARFNVSNGTLAGTISNMSAGLTFAGNAGANVFGEGNWGNGVLALRLSNGNYIQWDSSSNFTNNTPDLGLSRLAANVLSIDSGTGGNSAGTLVASSTGIGTSTPFGKFAINLNTADVAYTGNNAFIIASSTSNSTTTLFSISNKGQTIGTQASTTKQGVVSPIHYLHMTEATTTGWTATTSGPYVVQSYAVAPFNGTLLGARCNTDTGTLNVDTSIGSTHLTMLGITSTPTASTWSSNNTFVVGQVIQQVSGTPASSPTYKDCELEATETPQ